MRSNATVGLAMMSLKLAGDFVTKFEGPADHIPGGPKMAVSEMHVLPTESPNFKWRIRADIHAGESLPLNDVVQNGFPSAYVVLGWSLNNLSANAGASLLNSNETETSVMVDKSPNPNWNQ